MKRLFFLNIVRRGDAWLIGAVSFAALLALCLSQLAGARGNYVRVSVDGVALRDYSLSEEGSFTLEQVPMGPLTFLIQDGFVSVTESHCPNLDCVRHRRIRRSGESILCLPNRVAIEVIGYGDAPDSVTR